VPQAAEDVKLAGEHRDLQIYPAPGFGKVPWSQAKRQSKPAGKAPTVIY